MATIGEFKSTLKEMGELTSIVLSCCSVFYVSQYLDIDTYGFGPNCHVFETSQLSYVVY